MFRIGRRSLELAAAKHQRYRTALRGADYHAMDGGQGRVWLAPQNMIANRCLGPQRIVPANELHVVLTSFRRLAGRFAVLVDPDAVVLRRIR